MTLLLALLHLFSAATSAGDLMDAVLAHDEAIIRSAAMDVAFSSEANIDQEKRERLSEQLTSTTLSFECKSVSVYLGEGLFRNDVVIVFYPREERLWHLVMVFSPHEGEWRCIGCLEPRTHYQELQWQIHELSFPGQWLLLLTERATGTGFVSEDTAVYAVGEELRRILELPHYEENTWSSQRPRREVRPASEVRIEESENSIAFSRDYTVSFYLPLDDDSGVFENEPVFTRTGALRYTWDTASGAVTLDPNSPFASADGRDFDPDPERDAAELNAYRLKLPQEKQDAFQRFVVFWTFPE